MQMGDIHSKEYTSRNTNAVALDVCCMGEYLLLCKLPNICAQKINAQKCMSPLVPSYSIVVSHYCMTATREES